MVYRRCCGVSDVAHPLARQCGGSLPVWRDGGYALGACWRGFWRPAGVPWAIAAMRCSHLLWRCGADPDV